MKKYFFIIIYILFGVVYVFSQNLDDTIIFIDNSEHIVEFDDYCRESIILSISDYSVCDENCKGICFECGTNLNKEECKCSRKKSIDPRLQKLAEIADKMRKDNNN